MLPKQQKKRIFALIQQYGTLRVSIKSGHNRRFMLFVREKYQDSYE
jgi:hypothetical protein